MPFRRPLCQAEPSLIAQSQRRTAYPHNLAAIRPSHGNSWKLPCKALITKTTHKKTMAKNTNPAESTPKRNPIPVNNEKNAKTTRMSKAITIVAMENKIDCHE